MYVDSPSGLPANVSTAYEIIHCEGEEQLFSNPEFLATQAETLIETNDPKLQIDGAETLAAISIDTYDPNVAQAAKMRSLQVFSEVLEAPTAQMTAFDKPSARLFMSTIQRFADPTEPEEEHNKDLLYHDNLCSIALETENLLSSRYDSRLVGFAYEVGTLAVLQQLIINKDIFGQVRPAYPWEEASFCRENNFDILLQDYDEGDTKIQVKARVDHIKGQKLEGDDVLSQHKKRYSDEILMIFGDAHLMPVSDNRFQVIEHLANRDIYSLCLELARQNIANELSDFRLQNYTPAITLA